MISLLNAYDQLRLRYQGKWQPLAALTPVTLVVETFRLQHFADVCTMVKDGLIVQGWYQAASTQQLFHGHIPNDALKAPLLSAELLKEHESMHVLWTGSGWLVQCFRDCLGDQHAYADISFVSTEPQQRLKYRQYWNLNPDASGTLRVVASRFLGFKGDNQ